MAFFRERGTARPIVNKTSSKTSFDVIHDYGILQPKLVNRFRINEMPILKEYYNGFTLQTVSFEYHQGKDNVIAMVLEDDIYGRATGAIAHLPRKFNLSVSLLDGNEFEFCTLEFQKVKIENLSYSLDYSTSATCKYELICSFKKLLIYHATLEEMNFIGKKL